MFDGQQLGETIVAQVKSYLEREVASLKAENAELRERLTKLEARPAPEKGDKGDKGEDAQAPSLEAVWNEFLPQAEEIIREAVSVAVEALPKPEKGEKGDDGQSIEPSLVEEMVAGAVAKAVAELPTPKDGNDGKDAAGIVEALKDNGELVLTLQDGRLIRTGIRDGKDGKRGRDGFGFDDMDVCVLDDDRTIELSFRKGEDEKAFTLKWPTVIDRGVYKATEEYEAGDGTTWGGSFWIAQRAISAGEKPDSPESGWRLAVKRGRDGKDAK
jgi:integrin beta 3